MIVTAWNNGKHHDTGAGYGLKVSVDDRDAYFDQGWQSVILELQGRLDPIVVRLAKASFWSPKCRELISKPIGQWLRENGKAPWPSGHPPKLKMEPIGGNRFSVLSS